MLRKILIETREKSHKNYLKFYEKDRRVEEAKDKFILYTETTLRKQEENE